MLWSSARVGDVPLRDWNGWQHQREEIVADNVRRAGQEVIRRKGATNHAIGMATADLLSLSEREQLEHSAAVLRVASGQ